MSAPSTPNGRRERPNWNSANSLLTRSLDALRTAVAAETAFDASAAELQASQQVAREREQATARLEQEALEAERIAAEAARRAASRRAAAQRSEEELEAARQRVQTSEAHFEDRRRAFNHHLSELRTTVDAAGIAIGTHDPHPLQPKPEEEDRSGEDDATGAAQRENRSASNGRANGPSSFFSALASRLGHSLLHAESNRSEDPTSSRSVDVGDTSSSRRASTSSGDRLSSNFSPSTSALIRRGHSGPEPSTSSSRIHQVRMRAAPPALVLQQGRGSSSTSAIIAATSSRVVAPRIRLPSSSTNTSGEMASSSYSSIEASMAVVQVRASDAGRSHEPASSSITASSISRATAEFEMVHTTSSPLGPSPRSAAFRSVPHDHREQVEEMESSVLSGDGHAETTDEPTASTPRKRTFQQAQSADASDDIEDSTSGQPSSALTDLGGTGVSSREQDTERTKRPRTDSGQSSMEGSVGDREGTGSQGLESGLQHGVASTRQATDQSSQLHSRTASGSAPARHPMRLRSSSPTGELLCLDERNEVSTSFSGGARTRSGSGSHNTSSGNSGSARSCSGCGTKSTSSWKHHPKAIVRDDGIIAVTEGVEAKATSSSSSPSQAERPLLCQACYMRVRREMIREHVQHLSPARRSRPRQGTGEEWCSHASGSGSTSLSVLHGSSQGSARHGEVEVSDSEKSMETHSETVEEGEDGSGEEQSDET